MRGRDWVTFFFPFFKNFNYLNLINFYIEIFKIKIFFFKKKLLHKTNTSHIFNINFNYLNLCLITRVVCGYMVELGDEFSYKQ